MKNKNLKGFTLLELLIALSLMAVISITATQMLRTTTTKTKKITSDMDDLNRLRSAFNIIRTDLLKAFNYRDLNLFLYNEAQKERAQRYDERVKNWVDKYNKEKKPSQPVNVGNIPPAVRTEMEKEIGPRPEPKPPREERIVTQFIGDKEKLYFTTGSGFRYRKADKISELMEVGYYIKTCTSRKFRQIESDCLWRSVSYNLDGDVLEDGEGSVLIENVDKMEVRYLGYTQSNEVEWFDNWDSTKISDMRYGEMFPAGVQINLTVDFPRSKDGEKVKTQTLSGFFPINHPNNKPFQKLKTPDTNTGNPSTVNSPQNPTTRGTGL